MKNVQAPTVNNILRFRKGGGRRTSGLKVDKPKIWLCACGAPNRRVGATTKWECGVTPEQHEINLKRKRQVA
jgi:hypothetical protein